MFRLGKMQDIKMPEAYKTVNTRKQPGSILGGARIKNVERFEVFHRNILQPARYEAHIALAALPHNLHLSCIQAQKMTIHELLLHFWSLPVFFPTRDPAYIC